jgi:uncharacterized protein (DUF2252 family)
MMKSWKKNQFKKISKEKKTIKRMKIKFVRKKLHRGWNCKNKNKKLSQTKQIVIKRIIIKFER